MASRRNDPAESVHAPASRPGSRGSRGSRGTRQRSATTHIAAGSRVIGDITGTTDLIIEGLVEGRLDMKSGVVVGASGVVKGEIQARAVRVAGTVDGNVRGLEEIEILPEGRVQGDVVSPRVMISDGSFFKGNVEMDSDPITGAGGGDEGDGRG